MSSAGQLGSIACAESGQRTKAVYHSRAVLLDPDNTIKSPTSYNQVGVSDDLGEAGAAVSAA